MTLSVDPHGTIVVEIPEWQIVDDDTWFDVDPTGTRIIPTPAPTNQTRLVTAVEVSLA
jgi:hypothetical protein